MTPITAGAALAYLTAHAQQLAEEGCGIAPEQIKACCRAFDDAIMERELRITRLLKLLCDTLPALDAYTNTGKHYDRDASGVLHLRLSPEFYAAQDLYTRFADAIKENSNG